jgi:hypothetical protein
MNTSNHFIQLTKSVKALDLGSRQSLGSSKIMVGSLISEVQSIKRLALHFYLPAEDTHVPDAGMIEPVLPHGSNE